MSIPKDPIMLLSFINMKLRDKYPNLTELCKGLDIDEPELKEKLKSVGFDYMPDINQFK